jgi:diaminobutyrate-2-oxoglutarate transaminase
MNGIEALVSPQETSSIIERRESVVRSYCRTFPGIFQRASGDIITAIDGRTYIDFFCGAGSLNYGHNHPSMIAAVQSYIAENGILNSLDMITVAKLEFLDCLESVILNPRGLPHKVMFTGPTGTNSVEAALKIARKVTQKKRIICLEGSFHGMSLGSLSVSSSLPSRYEVGAPVDQVTTIPFVDMDTSEHLISEHLAAVDHLLAGDVAAIIVETTQAEGGVRVASAAWLTGLVELTKKHNALFIVDDIQVGCGRTGTFFSFERYGIEPDLICLSKSLSGLGLPLAILLLKPEYDIWRPGEHNGTFRGNNLAFVAGAEALRLFWHQQPLDVSDKSHLIGEYLESWRLRFATNYRINGMMAGIDIPDTETAKMIQAKAYERGLIIERCGPEDCTMKIMPPLTISWDHLRSGLNILQECLQEELFVQ